MPLLGPPGDLISPKALGRTPAQVRPPRRAYAPHTFSERPESPLVATPTLPAMLLMTIAAARGGCSRVAQEASVFFHRVPVCIPPPILVALGPTGAQERGVGGAPPAVEHTRSPGAPA